MGRIPPSCVVQMSEYVQASQYRPLGQTQPGEGPWQHGENSCAQVLSSAALMWDKRIPLFVYTWSLCTYCACLLAFCVRVFLLLWSPMTDIVLHGHHLKKKVLATGSWWLSEVLWAHATVHIFKRHCIVGLLLGEIAPAFYAWLMIITMYSHQFSSLNCQRCCSHSCTFWLQSICFFKCAIMISS